MNKLAIIALAGLTATASADNLLDIDLTVANQVTITATSGLASTSASGSNFTGFLLADFFAAPGAGNADSFLGAGTGSLSTAGNASDGTPSLFNGSTSVGLNVWSFSTDSTVGVTGGSQAFVGSATWSLTAAQYAAFQAGAASGDVIFNADTDDDAGVNIGTYRVIPAPSALALLGLGGLATARRRR
jgi:hypothetical protein